MFDPRKKTALVTGASSGIGARNRQAPHPRRLPGFCDRTLALLSAKPLHLDLSKDEEIKAAVDAILAEVGAIDVLVNNAGFGLYGPVEDVGLDDARYQFEVNMFGPARLTQLLVSAMRRKSAGTIVKITSMGGNPISRALLIDGYATLSVARTQVFLR